MCGQVGFSAFKGKVANPLKLKILLLYNESRGKDSFGMVQVNKEKQIKFEKEKDEVSGWLSVLDIDNDLETFIGHTRKSTIGESSKENAHPFKFVSGDDTRYIYGQHNGTITNFYELKKKYLSKYKTIFANINHFAVDSQFLIFMLFSIKLQVEDIDLSTFVSEIEGGTSFMYYDDTDTLTYFRNDGRSLYYGISEEGVYFSSLEESLFAIGCKKVKLVEQDKIFTMKNGSVIGEPVKVNFPERKEGKIDASIFNLSMYQGNAFQLDSENDKELIPLFKYHKLRKIVGIEKNEIKYADGTWSNIPTHIDVNKLGEPVFIQVIMDEELKLPLLIQYYGQESWSRSFVITNFYTLYKIKDYEEYLEVIYGNEDEDVEVFDEYEEITDELETAKARICQFAVDNYDELFAIGKQTGNDFLSRLLQMTSDVIFSENLLTSDNVQD